MNAPVGAPLTAPHVTAGGLCRWTAINKEGRHVGLDFYDLLIEGDYTKIPGLTLNWCKAIFRQFSKNGVCCREGGISNHDRAYDPQAQTSIGQPSANAVCSSDCRSMPGHQRTTALYLPSWAPSIIHSAPSAPTVGSSVGVVQKCARSNKPRNRVTCSGA